MDLFIADNFTNGTPWYVNKIFIPGVLATTTSLASATSLEFKIYADNAAKPAGRPRGGGAAPVWQTSVPPGDAKILLTTGAYATWPTSR